MRTATKVAVRKYMNADVEEVWGGGTAGGAASVDEGDSSGTARTETICAMLGSTPATAWPVMIACM